MPEFLNLVTAQRTSTQQEINEAMATAEQEMLNNGIVAVGDISNNSDSYEIKPEGNYIITHLLSLLHLTRNGQA